MISTLPREYVTYKYYQLGTGVSHNKSSDSYVCSCPICKEGKSMGRKKRSYYIPSKNIIYCHNCGWSSAPLKWITTVSGATVDEVNEEVREFSVDVDEFITNRDRAAKLTLEVPALPKDCINLFDATQVNFFKSNPVVSAAVREIKRRRLDTAVNRPRALFLSLNDKTHQNRIIISFYDDNGNIIFYQSRSFPPADADSVKYKSKTCGFKSLFNFDKITPDIDQVFIFEGPINSFFCKNGIAVAGIQDESQISLTRKQTEQIKSLKLFDIVWILDSQWIDRASMSKSKILANQGAKIFIWPKIVGSKYKDFNDLAIKFGIDEIPPSFIMSNTYTGKGAEIMLQGIN